MIYLTNFTNIPPSLRQRGYFCCWRFEERGGKRTKVPYSPITGGGAQTNRRNSFAYFETALRVVEQYDGIGFLIADGLFVIDLDHCFNPDRTLKLHAVKILEKFDGCYIERSPSGTGLHIIGYAPDFKFDKSKYWMNNRALGVEVYISGNTNRFMTVTGEIFSDGDILTKSAELQDFLDEFMQRSAAEPLNIPATSKSYLSDDDVINKATYARNGNNFKMLWNGDFSHYSSQSEADLALCGILAFWTNRDISQMDRLFRQSGLFREKWDRKQAGSTYGLITLQKAAGETKDVYHIPRKQRVPTGTGKPDLKEMKPEENPRYTWADIGAGRLFADYFRSVARYVPERKMWYCFDDSRWVPDIGAVRASEFCKQLADELNRYAIGLEDEKKKVDYMAYCRKWYSHNFRDTVLKEAHSVYPIQMKEFDNDIFVFNCENGTLHLNTMEFLPHNPEDKITKKSPVHYAPKIRCKRWDDFIVEVMSGDAEKAKFLQKSFGYTLSGDTQYECLFILHGYQTRNGKGTLCESVLHVMGDYGAAVSPETIALRQHNNSNSPSEDIARLAGIRFANISEPAKGLVLNSAKIKSMTGRDTLNARFLHENSFDFVPQFKLYINTNHLPIVTDMSVFKSNRVHVIPFERHFEESEQDHSLKREFGKPKNQTAILNWLVEGYRHLVEEGLTQTSAVSSATENYRHDSDKVGKFIEELLEPDVNAEERTSAVYAAYQKWCRRNGYYIESSSSFLNAMRSVVRVEKRRPKSGGGATNMLYGFRLLKPESGRSDGDELGSDDTSL